MRKLLIGLFSICVLGSSFAADSYRTAFLLRSTDSAVRANPHTAQPVFHQPPSQLDCRLPGEFETQHAFMIACRELLPTAPQLIVDLVRATRGRIEIVATVTCFEEYAHVIALLQHQGVPCDHVHFLELSHQTMWMRDYGPTIVTFRGHQPVVIDAGYEDSRINDDLVPRRFAQLLGLSLISVPLRLDGGNLISNGAGLVLSTERLVDENAGNADAEAISSLIGEYYGARQVVFLEPLAGESTGHVDMFAAFTSADTVVVGQYDPQIDPQNAAVLDRNAELLARTQTERGPLHVVRIPMPSNADGVWRTYTNVIFANGVLLVPTYHDERTSQTEAMSTYAKVLPSWQIIGIDATPIIACQGALHCVSINLGRLGRIPDFPPPRTRAPQSVATPPASDILQLNREWTSYQRVRSTARAMPPRRSRLSLSRR